MLTSARSRFFASLIVLATIASAAHGAQTAAVKKYSFELVTLNLSSRGRSGRDRTSGGRMQIDVPGTMSDEEVETVKRILDRLGASPPDDAGYRSFTLPNGTRGRIGFITDPEIAGAGVGSLPLELSVANEFSTAEAALVLQIATTANLFISNPADRTVVATTYQVTDRPFRKEHPRATVTLDENSLVDWIRQNIPASEVAAEN